MAALRPAGTSRCKHSQSKQIRHIWPGGARPSRFTSTGPPTALPPRHLPLPGWGRQHPRPRSSIHELEAVNLVVAVRNLVPDNCVGNIVIVNIDNAAYLPTRS